jgi:hypothetical protein
MQAFYCSTVSSQVQDGAAPNKFRQTASTQLEVEVEVEVEVPFAKNAPTQTNHSLTRSDIDFDYAESYASVPPCNLRSLPCGMFPLLFHSLPHGKCEYDDLALFGLRHRSSG